MREPVGPVCGILHVSRAGKPLVRAAVFTAVIGSMLGPASAASEVEGEPNAVKLRAENASIREVLDSISAKFKVSYRLPPTLTRSMTGEYSGTLNQVLARILDGNDYVVDMSDDTVRIVVLGASGGQASPTSAVAAVVAVSTPASGDQAAAPPRLGSRPPLAAPNPNLPASPSLPMSRPVPPLATYLPTNGTSTAGSAP